MKNNPDNLLSFDYPENKDRIISNILLKMMLLFFLIYIYFKDTSLLEKYVFIFFIAIMIIHIFIELKTFLSIDQVKLMKDSLLLLKNKKIKFKVPFSNLAFVIRSNPVDLSNNVTIDFYIQDSNKHLINLHKNKIDEKIFHDFIEKLSQLSGRNKDDFLTSSQNQLLSFSLNSMNEQTIKGEFIKYTKRAFFEKYNFFIFLLVLISIFITKYLMDH